MKVVFENGDEDPFFVECETLYDTLEEISLSDNDNQATKELWRGSTNGNARMLIDNKKTVIENEKMDL